MGFSTILKTLRKENNLTQSELARLAGISTSCISMIELEQREPTAQTIIALSKALNVSAGYLLGIEDDFGNVNVNNTLTREEQRLLNAFKKLNDVAREKLIEDAEFYAGNVGAGSGDVNVIKK